jgi:hypothetical protein
MSEQAFIERIGRQCGPPLPHRAAPRMECFEAALWRSHAQLLGAPWVDSKRMLAARQLQLST